MKWRKVVRILHRDFGYLAFGLTIIYAVSGIAVNHTSDWNPNYVISRDSLKIPPTRDSSLSKEEMVAYVITNLNEKDSVISSFKSSPMVVDIFFDGKSYKADLKTGRIKAEIVEDRAVIRQTNYLHLNAPKKIWTYVADAFAVILILLSVTGLFMIKGKKGITGRGKWLTVLGVLIPIIFLIIYF
ncbi:MAG: hypothetical protein GXO87_07780 [Chlorobi bacterium]|nr:hypothetical protein [Chlorobiota bacterium]